MYKIEYEIIKLSNPIKNKSHLIRLKNNNIPKEWVEQSKNLIKNRESLNSKWGNISNYKVNLLDFHDRVPENVDFIISEEYANRLKNLFDIWNNGNEKTLKVKFIDFLYDNFCNIISRIDEKLCVLNIKDKILLKIDIENIEILGFSSYYYNINMYYFNSLRDKINKIQNKINELKVK